jgi:FkbM family methyltransferase
MAKSAVLSLPKRAINKLRRGLFPLDSFLKEVSGVIHVGANTGQERHRYAALGLNVLWVEPNPVVFEELRSNIADLPNQSACRYLVAEEQGKEYTFHISNGGAQASSILDMAKVQDIWPDVEFTHEIQITATTLGRVIDTEHVDLQKYGALVLDTQGSELLVLKGAIPVLSQFRFVKSEVANFESYAGCCRLDDLTDFMRQQGFELTRKVPFASTRDSGGTYYDVLYRRL